MRRTKMRLCSFTIKDQERIGLVIKNDQIVDLNLSYATLLAEQGEIKFYELANILIPLNIIAFINGGISTFKVAEKTEKFINTSKNINGPNGEQIIYNKKEVKIKAPISRPPKFFCAAITNKTKWEKAIKPTNPNPTYFIKLHTCITGPYDPIEIPDVGVVGPEIEVAAVIGKKGKNIPIEMAEDYIFGYTIHNDITAHELRKDSEWIIVKRNDGSKAKITYQGRYKNFDTFAPMGPYLVTRDEINDIHASALKMITRINGEVVQFGTTADTVFPFPEFIHYLSKAHTLEPGDIISGGTIMPAPEWTMFKMDLRSLGGILESEIEDIGIMKNPIKPI